MRTPLSILSRGRLAGGLKKPLAMLSIGWLVTSSTPPIPPGGGGGGATNYPYAKSYEKDELEERRKRIKKNEQEWMFFIKIFSEQCQ